MVRRPRTAHHNFYSRQVPGRGLITILIFLDLLVINQVGNINQHSAGIDFTTTYVLVDGAKNLMNLYGKGAGFSRNFDKYSLPTVEGSSISCKASRSEPSFIKSFRCISALPFKRETLSRNALRFRRTARRRRSSLSKTVPKRKGRTVVRLKHSPTTWACCKRAFWPSSPADTYSLTMTANSPLG